MSVNRFSQLLAVGSLTLGLVAMQHEHHATPVSSGDGTLGRLSIPDVELRNQDGQPVHVYSDLVKGKVVAINTIFTTCTTICPTMGAAFSRLEKLLGDAPGTMLISISVDPAQDTPEMLKAWSAKFHRGSGWTLLTGSKPDVDRLLKAIGLPSADKEGHAPSTIVGSDRGWTRQVGLPSPVKLAEMMKAQLAAQRSESQ
jgi:protein SCO1/2